MDSLPGEILSHIVLLLDNFKDVCKLREVCMSLKPSTNKLLATEKTLFDLCSATPLSEEEYNRIQERSYSAKIYTPDSVTLYTNDGNKKSTTFMLLSLMYEYRTFGYQHLYSKNSKYDRDTNIILYEKRCGAKIGRRRECTLFSLKLNTYTWKEVIVSVDNVIYMLSKNGQQKFTDLEFHDGPQLPCTMVITVDLHKEHVVLSEDNEDRIVCAEDVNFYISHRVF